MTTTLTPEVKAKLGPLAEPFEQVGQTLKTVVDQQKSMADEQSKMAVEVRDEIKAMKDEIATRSKPQYPAGMPNYDGWVPNIRVGENPLTSRKMSFIRASAATLDPQQYGKYAKVERELSDQLKAAYGNFYSGPSSAFLLPFDTRHLPVAGTDESDKLGFGIDPSLVQKCMDLSRLDVNQFDPREFGRMMKVMTSGTDTSGGTFVALPGQGEMIELLKPMTIFDASGLVDVPLPPQGAIRYPRTSAGPTISAYAEDATITDSTPTTGEVTLNAKAYAGSTAVSDEFMKFSSVSAEAYLRTELMREIAVKKDRDTIDGAGGNAIKGLITYSAVNLRVAGTVAANGDTLDVEDAARAISDVEVDNIPISRFNWGIRPTLWANFSNRRGNYGGGAGTGGFLLTYDRFGAVPGTLAGWPVRKSTNIPATRRKGSGTTLTLVLGWESTQILNGTAGVVEIAVTDSHASEFLQRRTRVRATVFCDVAPRHEECTVYIDTLLET